MKLSMAPKYYSQKILMEYIEGAGIGIHVIEHLFDRLIPTLQGWLQIKGILSVLYEKQLKFFEESKEGYKRILNDETENEVLMLYKQELKLLISQANTTIEKINFDIKKRKPKNVIDQHYTIFGNTLAKICKTYENYLVIESKISSGDEPLLENELEKEHDDIDYPQLIIEQLRFSMQEKKEIENEKKEIENEKKRNRERKKRNREKKY